MSGVDYLTAFPDPVICPAKSKVKHAEMIFCAPLKSSAVRLGLITIRKYTTDVSKSPPSSYKVFDRHVKFLQKERAAACKEKSREVDYLKDEVAMRLVDRLLVSTNCLV